MCGCSKLAFTGSPAPCGCGARAFDGSGENNQADAITPAEAMRLVEKYLVAPEELVGLSAEDVSALKVARYAKMRYYFETNGLALTEANILSYDKITEQSDSQTPLLARHPFLKTAGFLVLLLALTLGGLYYFTQDE